MDVKARVDHLMDTAEFESVIAFDRCAVLLAQLESGEIVMDAACSKTPEEFDPEEAVKCCMISIHSKLTEVVSAQMAEPEEPKLDKTMAEVVVALAESSMIPAEASRKVGCSRSTMSRRIQKIQDTTGKNPLSFFELAQLLIEAREVLEV